VIDAFVEVHPELRWLYFVQHETRTGLLNPTIRRRPGLAVAADVVSAAWAMPVDLDALDVAVASSAKGIMAVPGLGIVFVRQGLLDELGRGGYYLDLVEETRTQRQKRQPRFAQPVALHAALHAACLHLEAVGVAAHQARIRRQLGEIEAGLGLAPLLPAAFSGGVAVNFGLPAGWVYADFAAKLEAEGYYLLYGIPGDPSHFQVSTMGDLTDEDVAGLVSAVTRVLGFDSARGSVGYRRKAAPP